MPILRHSLCEETRPMNYDPELVKPFLEWWQVLAGFFGFLAFIVMTDPKSDWW